MIPQQVFDQIPERCSEGLVLALASAQDGAIMELRWCNKAFTTITGLEAEEIVGQRGTVLIGRDVDKGKHLRIIERLMNWERFTITLSNTRKNGEQYWQDMTWTPLSDTETGDRWWLCSMAELRDRPVDAALSHAPPDIGARSAELRIRDETIQRLEKENARLYDLATSVTKESNMDSLTGLSNRRHFEIELQSWVANLMDSGAEFAVLYIDLDRFKFVNDTLGHQAGDRLLISVANLLRRLTDARDLIARLGGDEFVVLKRLGKSALSISSLADDIVQGMQAPFEFEGKSTSCGASVGVAIATAGMERPAQVVADADRALYHAKSLGRGRWSFFTEEMHEESLETQKLVSDLLSACESRAFIPYFQPLIDASNGRIFGAEVLVRWPHETRGLLAPGAFIETAAHMGILKRIDAIVFGHLAESLALFDRSGVHLPQVSINVSAGRLADPSLIHDIKSSGINPSRLTVEILESVYLERISDVMRWTLAELDDLGVTIAVDDFGTGHASVQGLLKIRPSVLKIDHQFIQPLVHNETSRALVVSIVGIGKSLDMRIVAEGIETEEHAHYMRDMGCDYLQGYHFGKPMSAADLRDRLRETGGQFWSPAARRIA